MKIKKIIPWLLLILLPILILLVGGYSQNHFFEWTGFSEYLKPDGSYERQKTLWDWMDLLIVPLILAAGALWFNQRREKLEHEIEESRVQEERLQGYLDRMTDLLLDNNLSFSQLDAVVRRVARARTFSILKTLSGDRKDVALRFLAESKLICEEDPRQKPVIPLDHVDLRKSNLEYYNLSCVDLAFADLRESKLQETILDRSSLNHARLERADLRRAHLNHANLLGAHLQQAKMENANLKYANLQQATLAGAIVKDAILGHVNLRDADLHMAINLQDAQLSHAYYSPSTKWPKDFNLSSVTSLHLISPESDLTDADLQQADLGRANLRGSNLKGAKLQQAFLGGADLEDINLEEVNLKGAFYTDNDSPHMIPPVGPTIFPKGFDPQAAGMVLVKSLETLPPWYREAQLTGNIRA